ncbi:hypothetical protein D3C73_1335220 [compost metagenome]
MSEEGCIDQRLAFGLEAHIIRRSGIGCGINSLQQHGRIPDSKLLFLALQPLKLQPGRHPAGQPGKSLQLGKFAPVRMKFYRQLLLQGSPAERIQHRMSNPQHRIQPIFTRVLRFH